ncbi:GGDEF domain-containing protein [Rhodovulum steppense]|uniref:diguanylate cyclase n=1 Tax=Rhodovulum steppense TaxID=540251 RepID=A0A4R1Z329_9RHOB|nr:GGDEF domain-containing protein [Rhodovulum steppense]TCM88067.1 diguanylate cyclase (GGDEF)-like protein [Rhodovulum steppense]
MKAISHPPAGPWEDDDLLHGTPRFVMVRAAPAVRQALALFSFLLAAVPAIGFLADIPLLHQPFPGEAGIPPPTLLALAALALAILIQRPFARGGPVERTLVLLAGLIGLGQLIWLSRGLPLDPEVTGISEAVGILALASALALRRRRPAWPAIVLAGAAGMICLTALLGHAMGIGQLRGALSPFTMVILAPLVLAAQIAQARRPELRTLFRDDRLTRVLRLEMALAAVVPAALAILIFRLDPNGPSATGAIYAQLMILFCCSGVLVAGRMRDRLDRERRALSRELQRASLIDSLTGLANRRGTLVMAGHAIHAARRGGRPVSMVICDLDHFKAINDRLGHGVGDRVLEAAARLMAARLRMSDVAGRWGGEEFLLVLPDTPLAGAEALAEILRHTLAEELRIMPSGEIGSGPGGKALTASFGCAAVETARTDGFDRALDAADQALYAAKQGGRNRVASATDLAIAGFG